MSKIIKGVSLSDFTGFIKKYAGELSSVSGVLKSVIGALPLPAALKTQIAGILQQLHDASERINEAADGLGGVEIQPPVVVKKSDIEAVVNAVLPALVTAAVDKALAEKAK